MTDYTKHYVYRLLAAYVDMFVCGLTLIILQFSEIVVNEKLHILPAFSPRAPIAFVLAICYLYFAVYQARYSMTIGKRLFRLKVVTISGERLGIVRMMLRYTLLMLPCFPIVLLFAIFDLENHRGLHDRAAGTEVVFW